MWFWEAGLFILDPAVQRGIADLVAITHLLVGEVDDALWQDFLRLRLGCRCAGVTALVDSRFLVSSSNRTGFAFFERGVTGGHIPDSH